MARPPILLNPGPVTLTERVRSALARVDLCHREGEFLELTLDIRRRLEGVYPSAAGRFEAVLLTGSGTAAVEAMLASLVPRPGKLLVVANGVYGERMAAMAGAHGKSVELVRSEWTEPMDLARVERALASDRAITHVACVHAETTTGRLNDVAALGGLCRAHGRPLLLDAVSSFGAEEIDFERSGVAAVAATANKCLHGAPGISFVLASAPELARCEGNAPSVYLDLSRYKSQRESGSSPFTLATHVCLALREALAEHEEQGGWEARRARYRAISGRVRDALERLGVRTVLDRAAYSSMISSFRLPKGWPYEELHSALVQRGFVIYAGQGDLSKTLFRVANMGDIADADVDRLLAVLAELLGR